MSEILFTNTVDNSQLKSGFQEAGKMADDYVKKVENSSKGVDSAFEKSTSSIKAKIAEQKAFVKGLTDEINKMQKAYDSATYGSAKSQAGKDLGQAKRQLSQETATLTRLQQEAAVVTDKESGAIGGLVGKIGSWVTGLFTLGAGLAVVKGVINSTESTQHEFERATTEAASATNYFFQCIASGDFSNFWKGLDKATQGASDYVDALEVIENKTNQQRILSANTQDKIAELRQQTYDKNIDNAQARIDGLKEIIRLTSIDYQQQKDIRTLVFNTELGKTSNDTGGKVSGKEIMGFIENYGSLDKVISDGEKYIKLQRELKGAEHGEATAGSQWGGGTGTRAGRTSTVIQAEIDAMGEAGKSAAEYAEKINLIPPARRKMLSEFKAQEIEMDSMVKAGNRRDRNQIEQAINQQKAKAEADAKTIKEIKDKEELSTYDQTQLGKDNATKDLDRKFILLKQNLDKQKDAHKENRDVLIELDKQYYIDSLALLKEYYTEVASADKGNNALDILSRAAWGGAKAGLPSKTGIVDATKYAKIGGKAKGSPQKEQSQEDLDLEASIRGEILKSVLSLNEAISKSIGLTEEEGSALASMIQGFASGGVLGYVSAFFSTFASTLTEIFKKSDEYADKLAYINALLEKNQKILSASARGGGEKKAYEDQIALLNNQIKTQSDKFKADIAKMEKDSKKWINAGPPPPPPEVQQAMLDKINKDAQDQLDQLKQEYQDLLSGGVTENTIADTIASGFQQGKTSVEDFADFTDQILKDAVMNVFKKEVLGKQMTDITTYISNSLSDGNLSQQEKDHITQMMQDQAAKDKQLWDQLNSVLPNDIGTPQALSGAIERQITEETGTELAGLMRRIADDVRLLTGGTSRDGVDHLMNIDINTANTVAELQNTVELLTRIANQSKPVYAKDLR